VDCESEASARTDFERISQKCGWSSESAKDQLASSEWQSLLVLDNCDDVKTDYSRYIPNGSQVSVILTTRLSDARKYASADLRDTERKKLFFRLDGLDTDSAVDLILEASDIEERGPETIRQAIQIANALDFHPLALNAASSLIRSAVYSLVEYADALDTRLAQKELLETESEQARYLKVSTTFEVSADSLKSLASTDPTAEAALALLDILGFMHHQDESEDIFVRAWEHEESVLSEFEGKDEDGDIEHLTAWHVTQSRSIFSPLPPAGRIQLFRKARALLGRLSLVSLERTRNYLSLHLLVHTWARERVLHPGKAWTAVASMLALSARGSMYWQPFTEQIVRHCKANFSTWQKNMTPEPWGLCRIWNIHAWQMARTDDMERLPICLELVSQAETLSFDQFEQSPVATAKHLLGNAYRNDDQPTEAIKILEQVVKVQENRLRKDHPSRTSAQHDLANAYRGVGRLAGSIAILEDVVAMQEWLPKDHPDRLESQCSLAIAYAVDGRITEAVEILEHVVKMQEMLSEGHDRRLAFQHELASVYQDNGRITEAIEILEHVVKMKEGLPEGDHGLLASQHELARAYWGNNQTRKAMELLEHVVMIEQQTLRNNDPFRVISVDLLARIRKEEDGLDDDEQYEDGELSEDGYEDSSSDRSSTGWENAELLARIKKEKAGYDDDCDKQYEGDDEDESNVEHEDEAINECKDEEYPNQDPTGSETSDSVTKQFGHRTIELVLRSRHTQQGDCR